MSFAWFSVGISAVHGRSTVLGFDDWVSVKLHGSVIHRSSSSKMQQQEQQTVLSFRHNTPIHWSVQHLQEICRNTLISVIVKSVLVFNTFATTWMANMTWLPGDVVANWASERIYPAIFDAKTKGAWGPFLESPENLWGPESHTKISNLVITELFYSRIFNINRGTLHTRSFRRIHLSVLRYRSIKNSFPGPNVSGGFDRLVPGEAEDRLMTSLYLHVFLFKRWTRG